MKWKRKIRVRIAKHFQLNFRLKLFNEKIRKEICKKYFVSIFIYKEREMSEHNGRIKQEINSRPQSPRSRSPSPKSDSNEREIKSESDQTKRVLKEIGNENGKDVRTKEDNTDDEDDVNILKEKLRKLEDDSKCSKCMVSISYSYIM